MSALKNLNDLLKAHGSCPSKDNIPSFNNQEANASINAIFTQINKDYEPFHLVEETTDINGDLATRVVSDIELYMLNGLDPISANRFVSAQRTNDNIFAPELDASVRQAKRGLDAIKNAKTNE